MPFTESPSKNVSASLVVTILILSTLFWYMTPTRGVSRVVTVVLAIAAGVLTSRSSLAFGTNPRLRS